MGESNILNSELLLNSTDMLSLILQLDLFEVLDLHTKADPQSFYSQIIHIMSTILSYDKKNENYLSIMMGNQQVEVDKKLKIKKDKKDLLNVNINPFALMNKLGGLVGNLVAEEPEEEEEADDQGTDD